MTTHMDVIENGKHTGIHTLTYDDGLVLRFRRDVGECFGCWSGPSKVWEFANGTFGQDDIRRERFDDALRAVYEFAVSVGEGKKGY
jgi:hypothetical protein